MVGVEQTRMKRLFAVSLCMASLVRVASAVGIPVNCSLFFNGSNAVQIAWNASLLHLL
jgi:hypothetical protein